MNFFIIFIISILNCIKCQDYPIFFGYDLPGEYASIEDVPDGDPFSSAYLEANSVLPPSVNITTVAPNTTTVMPPAEALKECDVCDSGSKLLLFADNISVQGPLYLFARLLCVNLKGDVVHRSQKVIYLDERNNNTADNIIEKLRFFAYENCP